MKKVSFLRGGVALLCAMFLVSCFNEETPSQPETVEVAISVGAESNLTTRAISDGTLAKQLMYGVFNEKNELIIAKQVKNDINGLLSEGGYNMSISLAKGHTYQVVFWAQNSECTAYTVSDDMKVTVNYEGINNDETRDAFFGKSELFKVDGSSTIYVTLKRPFAQINVGAWPFDLEQAKDLGVEVSKSSATIKSVANQLDLLTGEATGAEDITYSLNTVPNEDLMVDVDQDGNAEQYEWISMSYVLAGTTQSLHDMSFVFSDETETNTITFDDGLENIKINRNYRTNIVGQILIGTISFNVKIDPIYEGEDINSGGLYYNFSEDTVIKDKTFAFYTNEAATFTSENNNLVTMENVTFSGRVQYIALGDYIKKDGLVVVPFRNKVTKVVAKDMVVTHSKGITNVEPIDYMAPLFFFRGESTVEDCVITGTTTATNLLYQDHWKDLHEVLPYDCGVPNDGVATFNNCTIDRFYAWSHVQITLTGSKIKHLRCSTHNNTDPKSHLTVGDGCEIDEIFVTSSSLAKRIKDEQGNTHWDINNMWSPSLIIKSGAKVKVLNMNGRSRYDAKGNLDVIIEEGAQIGEIINEGTGVAS